MTRRERALELTADAKKRNLAVGKNLLAIARIYEEILGGDPPLWKVAGFDSFPEWLHEVGDHEASQAYKLADTYRELKTKIPQVALDTLPLNNARDLMLLPAREITADLVKAAAELPNRKLRRKIQEAQPHILLPENVIISFSVERSAEPWIKKAIQCVMERKELKTQGAALEWLCLEYLLGIGEAPEIPDERAKA